MAVTPIKYIHTNQWSSEWSIEWSPSNKYTQKSIMFELLFIFSYHICEESTGFCEVSWISCIFLTSDTLLTYMLCVLCWYPKALFPASKLPSQWNLSQGKLVSTLWQCIVHKNRLTWPYSQRVPAWHWISKWSQKLSCLAPYISLLGVEVPPE